jgi:hypothetical protein
VLAISRLPWAKFSRELHRFAHGYITCLASLSSPALLPCMGQVVPLGAVCQARALHYKIYLVDGIWAGRPRKALLGRLGWERCPGTKALGQVGSHSGSPC